MTKLSVFTFNFEGRDWKFRIREGTFDIGIIQEVAYDPFYAISRFLIGEKDVVIDVGAHIGAFSIFAAARGAKVIALEPVQENFELLEENLRLNHLQDVIKPIKAALWTMDSLREIRKPHPDEANTGAGGFFYSDPRALVETVECITLQTLFEKENIQRCSLLKMDCEGAEFEILHALSGSILGKIDAIVLEYHLRQDADFQKLLNILYLGNFLVDWEQRAPYLGMLIGVRESRLDAEIFRPWSLSWAMSPVVVDSRISRVPILGSLEKRIREHFHKLVIFYLKHYFGQCSAVWYQNSLYLRLLIRHLKHKKS